MIPAKDLTKEPPRSPRERVRDYAVLGRTIDKCRALLAGKIGDYHYDCPLDNMLFGFKGVSGDDLKAEVERGASDEELGIWLDAHGEPKTPEEIREWSHKIEGYRPYDEPDRRDWFYEQCKAIGLDAARITLFDWLEADDKTSYK